MGCHMPSYLKSMLTFKQKTTITCHRCGVSSIESLSTTTPKTKCCSSTFKPTVVRQVSSRRQNCKTIGKHSKASGGLCVQYRYLGAVAALREVVRIKDSAEARNRLREAFSFRLIWTNSLPTHSVKYLRTNRLRQWQPTCALWRSSRTMPNAHGRLGTEYARVGNRAKAIEHWTVVAQHDPNDAYGLGMLACRRFLERREADALELYKQGKPLSQDRRK